MKKIKKFQPFREVKYISKGDIPKQAERGEKDLYILYGDDWEIIYHKGKFLGQGHQIDYKSVLKDLGYKIDSMYLDDDEWTILDSHDCKDCKNDLDKTFDVLRLSRDIKKYNL